MELDEATTHEIFDELQKRNHTVMLSTAKLLDHERIEYFTNSSGSYALIYGMIVKMLVHHVTADVLQMLSEDESDEASFSDDDGLESGNDVNEA